MASLAPNYDVLFASRIIGGLGNGMFWMIATGYVTTMLPGQWRSRGFLFISAGANLAFFPLGTAFRHAGAFFIRRSFAGDRVFPVVFGRYLHELVHLEVPIEFFLEGGRSRTGKLLPPKLGVLGMVLDAAASATRADREVSFLPIYIGYEQIAEERAYARELSGARKEKESVQQVAKAAGVRVHVFSIGFGKALVKWQRGETEYRIAMLPFGGYVQMAGQDPLAERAPQDAGRSLLDKPPIVRILVFLAGPAMNLILPFAILVPLYGVGEAWRTVPSNTVGAVDAGMPAGLPGKLQAGDTIVAIDGEPVQAFWQTTRRMERYDATQGPLKLTVERGLDRAPVEVEVSPREWSETHSMLGYRTRSY
jgi:hypothetical protein